MLPVWPTSRFSWFLRFSILPHIFTGCVSIDENFFIELIIFRYSVWRMESLWRQIRKRCLWVIRSARVGKTRLHLWTSNDRSKFAVARLLHIIHGLLWSILNVQLWLWSILNHRSNITWILWIENTHNFGFFVSSVIIAFHETWLNLFQVAYSLVYEFMHFGA